MLVKITALSCDDGTFARGYDAVAQEVLKFSTGLLGSEDFNVTGGYVGYLSQLLSKKLSSELQQTLIQDVIMEEVKAIIHSLPSSKSPSLDGFTGEFYKAIWDIIGSQLTEAIQEFFSTGSILKDINATAITLVPKCLQPSKVLILGLFHVAIYFINVLQKSWLIG